MVLAGENSLRDRSLIRSGGTDVRPGALADSSHERNAIREGRTVAEVLGFEYSENWGYPAIANVRIGSPVLLTRLWTVPDWAVVLALAAAPAVWAIRRRKREWSSPVRGFTP